MIADVTRFQASLVQAVEESFTPDYTVHGIYFGDGDPDAGGQHWNFSRGSGDDDGVCTVKEPQVVTLYGGIESFSLTRHRLECGFTEAGARESGTRRLVIDYAIADDVWTSLVQQAKYVFGGEPYAVIDWA